MKKKGRKLKWIIISVLILGVIGVVAGGTEDEDKSDQESEEIAGEDKKADGGEEGYTVVKIESMECKIPNKFTISTDEDTLKIYDFGEESIGFNVTDVEITNEQYISDLVLNEKGGEEKDLGDGTKETIRSMEETEVSGIRAVESKSEVVSKDGGYYSNMISFIYGNKCYAINFMVSLDSKIDYSDDFESLKKGISIMGETNTEKDDLKGDEGEGLIEDGIDRISSGEYLFITNEDLDKYCANMEGAKIYVVTEIDDIDEGVIQSNISDGYMMSNFHVGENYEQYESKLKEGDIVGISGTVAGNDGYGFMGKSVNVEDCLVFSMGKDAEEYKKERSDEGLSKYFTVTEEVADSGEDISEEEYKALCEILDYEDILRNPDSNSGKCCKVEGTAEQIIEGWFGSFTIYVTDYNGNKWGCVYSYKDGESRLLEGDTVTIYGKCEGTDTAETLLGEQVTLPRIDVVYVN